MENILFRVFILSILNIFKYYDIINQLILNKKIKPKPLSRIKRGEGKMVLAKQLEAEKTEVEGWETTKHHLKKARAINSIQDDNSFKRIIVLKVSFRKNKNEDTKQGWAYLSFSQNCIIVHYRERASESADSNLGLAIWHRMLIFKNNPWIFEITVLSDEPMLFSLAQRQIQPFSAADS